MPNPLLRPREKISGAGTCSGCRHFQNDPHEIEAIFPGLQILSSGSASVRAQDGLCTHFHRYSPAWDTCSRFLEKTHP